MPAVAIFGGAMVTHVISAKVGMSRTSECREARENEQRKQMQPYYPPQPYSGGWPAGAGAPPPQPYPQQTYPQQPYSR